MIDSAVVKKLVLLVLVLLPGMAWAQLSLGIRGGLTTSSYSYQATAVPESKK